MAEEGFTESKLTHFDVTGDVQSLYGAYEDKWDLNKSFSDGWEMSASYPMSTSDGYLHFVKKVDLGILESDIQRLLVDIMDDGSDLAISRITRSVVSHVNDHFTPDLHIIACDIHAVFTEYPVQCQFLFQREKAGDTEVVCEIAFVFGEKNIEKRYRLDSIGTKLSLH